VCDSGDVVCVCGGDVTVEMSSVCGGDVTVEMSSVSVCVEVL